MVETIENLKVEMEEYLIAQFKVFLDASVSKNAVQWKQVTANHTDID